MKSFRDFNIFEKIFMHQRSVYNKIATPIRLFVDPKRNIQKIYDDQDEIEEVKNKTFESSLYKFNSPASLIDWIYDTDIQIGGGSEAVLYHDLKNQMIRFQGKISDENFDLLKQRQYAVLQSYYFQRLSIGSYNGLKFRIKTDGKLYKVFLQLKGDYDNNFRCYAFMIDKSNEWQDLEIPLGCFLLEKTRGYDDTIFLSEISEIEDLRLDNIAIALETEEAGEFKFEMQEIKLVYNPDFEELQKQYKRPFFFYQQSSYKNCKLINTGQDLLYMRESVEQTEEIQQEQKEKQFYEQQRNGEQKMGHTINNLYDQKKGKKITSFGEFLKKKN